jgi:integrase
MADEEYLFHIGNEGNNLLSTVEAYRILNIVAAKIGIEEIEPYTLRRTFGYWNYKQNKDVTLLQRMFNHSAPSVTLRYIGIEIF